MKNLKHIDRNKMIKKMGLNNNRIDRHNIVDEVSILYKKFLTENNIF